MSTIVPISIYKPPQVVAEAAVTLEVTEGPATFSEVLDFGLSALGETRTSLFGYGVRLQGQRLSPANEPLGEGVYTVYAHRD